MKNSEVLITGLGVISAAGRGLSVTLDSFKRVDRNAGPVSLFTTSLECPVFEVRQIPAGFIVEKSRTLSLALCALDEAMDSTSLGDLTGLRVGVSIGTTVASQLNDLEFYRSYRQSGNAPMEVVDRYIKGNIAEFIARKISARGPALTVVNACSSGTDAIGMAFSWLKTGLCDIAVAGGADELSLIPLCGFSSLGIVNQSLCSPFDRDRRGLNLGEGAGILILETEASAKLRGKSSDLCILGYGASADAYHLTAPRPDGAGLEASINKALAEAGIGPGEICFVNAHGTGTTDNDLVEGKVLGRMFGPDLKVLSTKGFTGHTLGAAGGLEAAFTAAGLSEGWIPSSPGFRNKDDDIPITPVKEETRIKGRYAVSTSLAFGGNNAALLLGRG
ncbi:MAG: beta-ketoacyl-[acyl-carrier-protein] synthase family protein [Nitrospira bacterium HGW-Nitrospira-1]|nr:MAG: beta-ketoacyl-[acyl-carrier-protein] synthase family protein [Nitrospira bacterium HGW-Nitrospira-1]